MNKTVHIHYFAKLREERGRSTETIETTASTPRELYDQLQSVHGLSLDPGHLRVAINEEFGDWESALGDQDTVVFLQPAAGG